MTPRTLVLLALLHALTLVAISAHCVAAYREADARAAERVRLGCVCEGHGRGNLPLWSDDGTHWHWPPNMRQLEAM